ncbi:hypothetical protein T440DRAFT_475365 [Plenodomus tracheiphilus IPT5]|uniref:Uncharacterized protein n=1 Tax=Plenodomus tracheiphilus IPT5 TaxID=1408161 RepID=A0A6A7BI65_9PLEO|nr:hypothetical protein T440DRAFT_475365 [Plenodomus tracheiphilus IPT5]
MSELDNAAMQPVTRVEEQDWMQRLRFEIPSYRQAYITDAPQLAELYDAYQISYTDVNSSNATCMQHAKSFAFALLTYYYPASDGFIVAPCSPGPTARNGMSFLLAADDNSDIWDFAPPQKARRKRQLSKKQKEINDAAEYGYCLDYIGKSQWHRIEAEDIAAFVIQRDVGEAGDASATLEGKTHTHLVIMIDEVDSLSMFSKQNTLERSDILTDLLCSQGKVQHGYGILLHGPLLEVYDFDRGAEFVHYADDSGKSQDIEPKMVHSVGASGVDELVVDTRTAGLKELDGVLRHAAAMEVTHVQHGSAGVSMDLAVDHHGAESGVDGYLADTSSVHDLEDHIKVDGMHYLGSDIDAEGEDDDEYLLNHSV